MPRGWFTRQSLPINGCANAMGTLCLRNISRVTAVRRQANAYDEAASQGELNVIYLFGQQGINEEDIKIDMNGITIPGFEKPITYATDKQYPDF